MNGIIEMTEFDDGEATERQPDASRAIVENSAYREWALRVLRESDENDAEVMLELLEHLFCPISGPAGDEIGVALRARLDSQEPYIRFTVAVALAHTRLSANRALDVEWILRTGVNSK